MDIYCFILFMFYGCIVGNIVLFYYVGVVFVLDIYVRYVYFCKLFILKVIFLIFVMDIILESLLMMECICCYFKW